MSLDTLITRMERALADPDTRPLWLHWSDLELLKALRDELTQDDQRIETLRQALGQALSAAIDQALPRTPKPLEIDPADFPMDWETAQFVWEKNNG